MGKIVLEVGEEKNRAEWRRGKVVKLIIGKANVIRGVRILTKGHTIERPLQLICSLEIKESKSNEDNLDVSEPNEMIDSGYRKSTRQAATDAKVKIRQVLQDEED